MKFMPYSWLATYSGATSDGRKQSYEEIFTSISAPLNSPEGE